MAGDETKKEIAIIATIAQRLPRFGNQSFSKGWFSGDGKLTTPISTQPELFAILAVELIAAIIAMPSTLQSLAIFGNSGNFGNSFPPL